MQMRVTPKEDGEAKRWEESGPLNDLRSRQTKNKHTYERSKAPSYLSLNICNSFIYVQLTYNNLHIFKIYNLVCFDLCIHL